MIRSEAYECTKSELDLFSVPGVVTSMTDSQWVRYSPTTTVAGDGPIRFDIQNPFNSCIDLAQCHLRVTFKLRLTHRINTKEPMDPITHHPQTASGL